MHVRRRTLAPLALVMVLVLAACQSPIDQKAVYTTEPTQTITGAFPTRAGDPLTSVTVNGVAATLDGQKFSATIPLDGAAVFTPVLAVATYQSGYTQTDRSTVAYADGPHASLVNKGSAVSNGVSLRMNQQAFDKLGPVVQSLTTIDTASITPPGTVVLDECVLNVLVCQTWARATIAAPPTLGGFDVALHSQTGSTRADVTLHDLDVFTQVNTWTWGVISMPCQLRIHADTVYADGSYVLSPDASNPEKLHVNLWGTTDVSLSGVSHDWVGGLCSLPLISDIVDMMMPNVQDMMQSNLATALADPDGYYGPAQSPIAKAIQDSLAQVNIAGPIGESMGVNLAAPIHGVTQDSGGVALRADSTFSALGLAPGAPAQAGSLGFGAPGIANPGSTTPDGQPYDVAVGASITAFNQLLAAETERGLLNLTVTEMNGQPLTLKGLLDSIGLGAIVTEDRPMKIVLTPELAPSISTATAPAGALGVMHMAGFRSDIIFTDDNTPFLSLALDFDSPANMAISNGALKFVLTPPPADQVHIDIIKNPMNLPANLVAQSFGAISPGLFAQLGDLLPAFPLPQLVGLTLQPITTARVGDSFFLYSNLA